MLITRWIAVVGINFICYYKKFFNHMDFGEHGVGELK
jgi:hypothetical protein